MKSLLTVVLLLCIFSYFLYEALNESIKRTQEKQVSQRVIPKEAIKEARERFSKIKIPLLVKKAEVPPGWDIYLSRLRDEAKRELTWHEKAEKLGIDIDEINRIVAELESNNQVTTKCYVSDAYIDPLFWYKIDVFQKELLSKALALYCAEKNDYNPDAASIDIFNVMSGKKIAKYSPWGFKVY